LYNKWIHWDIVLRPLQLLGYTGSGNYNVITEASWVFFYVTFPRTCTADHNSPLQLIPWAFGFCCSIFRYMKEVMCIIVCPFSFGYCIVCPLIYSFWLNFWYLQTFLETRCVSVVNEERPGLWLIQIQNISLVIRFTDIS
jgi:hypothetical protein